MNRRVVMKIIHAVLDQINLAHTIFYGNSGLYFTMAVTTYNNEGGSYIRGGRLMRQKA